MTGYMTSNKNLSLADEPMCPYKIPSVDDIIKVIDSASYRVSKSQLIADVLACGAISISNMVDASSKEEREHIYREIMQKYKPEERDSMVTLFSMIYGLLSSVVYQNGHFGDHLGELYMRCNQGNKRTGQFFTPYHISRVMAKMAVTKEPSGKSDDDILTLCDPCCGGGGLMIAALDVLKNDCHFNYAANCFIECSDIDINCVYMTYLQLSLAGVPAIVKHENSLTKEVWSVWRTPAFILQYPRFYMYDQFV